MMYFDQSVQSFLTEAHNLSTIQTEVHSVSAYVMSAGTGIQEYYSSCCCCLLQQQMILLLLLVLLLLFLFLFQSMEELLLR